MAEPIALGSGAGQEQRWRRMVTIAIPLSVVAVVVMLVVPLPTFVVDLLITANITGSILILLTAMQVKRPLDFSVFPTLVLVATMFRLALNVAATRLILLHGYAGVVIESFGHFVIGGSILVGLVVFFILIVIQFVVITYGAGRVAEVGARFTLDAMPGKQMAIDADLHAGAIDEAEAKRRRQEVADEADFYGAMDGASKFVRGDAIAAIVITAINLIGGLAIGVVQHHLSLSDAIYTYSLLSVGDGLVSQIPALLLSLSTGIIVTRAATEHDLGHDVLTQLSRYRRIVRTTGLVMAGLAIIPGLPKLPFLLVGGSVFFFGTRLPKDPGAAEAEPEQAPAVAAADTPESIAAGIAVEQLVLELGLELIDLVQTERGGDLLDRVKALRRNVATELGIVMPQVHTRDNLDLPPSVYAIRVQGIEVARGEAPRGSSWPWVRTSRNWPESRRGTRHSAAGPSGSPPSSAIKRSVAGVTVVDRSAVVTTHLAEVVREHAGTILSRQDTKLLLDALKGSNPVVLEEMAAANVTLGDVQGVLRGLLDEGVPVRDLVRIVESTPSRRAPSRRTPTACSRRPGSHWVPPSGRLFAVNGTIPIITMAPSLEQGLIASIRTGDRGRTLGIEAAVAESLVRQVAKLTQEAESRGVTPVLLCATRLRLALRRLLKPSLPRLAIVGAGEIGAAMSLDTVGSVADEAVVAQ